MALNKDLNVTAYVVVYSEKEGSPQQATSANISEWLPSAERLAQVAAMFRRAGFQVGAAAANSIPVSATVAHFEEFFQHSLEEGKQGYPKGDLPLRVLPDDLKLLVAGIGFPSVPDFGPGSY